MNAPANIAAPAWAKYAPAVEVFRPTACAKETQDRCRIMMIRDRALNAAAKCSWEASASFQAVASVAAQHAYTEMTLEQLDATHIALLRLYLAACQLDLVFAAPEDGR